MFSYYGSKSKIVKKYPKPYFDKIIEPFAGSARYALEYFEKDVLLVDKYDVVINLWKWLQSCSESDILGLPRYNTGDRIIREHLDCDEQYELIRFLMQQGTVGGNKVYQWGVKSYEQNLKRIADSLFKIRHWKFKCGEYTSIENCECTWFVDPPYQNGGHKYRYNNKGVDYDALAQWISGLAGQVIVCENTKADWMPFNPLVEMQGIKFITTEAMWTNR